METFRHSHSLGQNFLTDKNLLAAIVSDAGVSADDVVIEVGAGMGALTRPLAASGARVISYEVDDRLREYLEPLKREYANLELCFGDFMKEDISKATGGARYKAVANLPYYITTPVLFRFLEDPLCDGVTVMVQKEVAERITAKAGGKDYGALSLAVQYYAEAKIIANVPQNCFIPRPNVGSAVIRLKAHKNPPVEVGDKEYMFSLIKAAFLQRRKTLSNALKNESSLGLSRDEVVNALKKMGLPEDVRGERLSLEEFAGLSDILKA